MSCRKEPNSAMFCRKVLNSALINWSSFSVWLVSVSAGAGLATGGLSADPSLDKLAAMDSYAGCKACKSQPDLEKDTIEISRRRIRLFGIDAPENGQTCTIKRKPFRCDQAATSALADKIGAHIVECEPKDLDIYSRIVSVCFVEDEDINAWMVAKGWALAYRQYSRDYVSQEERASKEKLGMWQGEFELPWDWRQRASQSNAHLQPDDKQPNSEQSKDCAIKGNINDRGRHIYHMPGDKFYSRTIISAAKGERWFCSEAEAVAAGWQRSRR